jgi:hypothetical protein
MYIDPNEHMDGWQSHFLSMSKKKLSNYQGWALDLGTAKAKRNLKTESAIRQLRF